MDKRDIQEALDVIQEAAGVLPSGEIVIGSDFVSVMYSDKDAEYLVPTGADLIRLINAIKTIDEFER